MGVQQRKKEEKDRMERQWYYEHDQYPPVAAGRITRQTIPTRISEVDSEIDAENRRFADAQKSLQESERNIKELSYQLDEDRKNIERLRTLIESRNLYLVQRNGYSFIGSVVNDRALDSFDTTPRMPSVTSLETPKYISVPEPQESSSDDRIVNGYEARSSPWMVALYIAGITPGYCSGSLINTRYAM